MRLPAAVDDKYLKSSRALNAREYSIFRRSTLFFYDFLFLLVHFLHFILIIHQEEGINSSLTGANYTHLPYINSSTVTQLWLYHALSSSTFTMCVPSIALLFWLNELFQGASTTRVCTLRKLTWVWKAQKSVVSVFFSFLDFLTLISESKACAAHFTASEEKRRWGRARSIHTEHNNEASEK